MPAENDSLARFRVRLASLRNALDLSPAEAAERAGGLSGQRWRDIERGYEVKGGTEISANPRRRTLIKMAQAVNWDPDDALRTAGLPGLRPEESRRASGPVRELIELAAKLPEQCVWALVYTARVMTNPRLSIPLPVGGDTVAFSEMVVVREINADSTGSDAEEDESSRGTH